MVHPQQVVGGIGRLQKGFAFDAGADIEEFFPGGELPDFGEAIEA